MYQIINNAKSLAELCTTPTNNWLQGIYAYNDFLMYNTNNGTGQNIIYPSAFLTYVLETYGASVLNKVAFIYRQVIWLFAHAVPYNQNTQTYTFPTTTDKMTFVIPDIFYEIDAYFSMYQNKVLQYVLLQTRLDVQIQMVQQQMSNERKRTQGVDTNFKDSANSTSAHINTTSFNPVAQSTKITTQPIGVATPTAPGMDNTVSATTTANENTSEATYSTLSTGKNSNSLQNTQQNLTESETYQNIQLYEQVGHSDFKVALRPLLKKIARLFMQLGNNYHQDITPLNVKGLNVW